MGNSHASATALLDAVQDILERDNNEQLEQFIVNSFRKKSFPRLSKDQFTEIPACCTSRFGELIHMATLKSAHKCVTMLVNAPYHCSPDIVNSVGHTAMQVAEHSDDLHSLYIMANRSQELRPTVLDPSSCGEGLLFISKLLFWPQYAICRGYTAKDFGALRNAGAGFIRKILGQRRSWNARLTGAQLALLYELLMSNPTWKSRTASPETNTSSQNIWPLNPTDYTTPVGHHSDCTDYPSCLINGNGGFSDEYCMTFSRLVWRYHRFQTNTCNGDGWGCLSLKDQCRVVIRRHILTQCYSPATTTYQVNYARLVGALNLPSLVYDFLLYKELWFSQPWVTELKPDLPVKVPLVKRKLPGGRRCVALGQSVFLR